MSRASFPAEPSGPYSNSPDVLLELQIQHSFDDEPGVRRRRTGRGFTYIDRRGRPVDAETRVRINGLVIPPAWREVWICPTADGHIQATGRDARGRKQYIYHPAWREWREQAKFQHILDFAAALPRLRLRVAKDLYDRKLSRDLVLATAIRVLDRTLMRVGNDEYARNNQSYGLTTLRDEHIESAGARVRFGFRGKHGKLFEAEFSDRRVAAILRRLEGLPGQHIFQFLDEAGRPHRIGSDDINRYIREATGGDFTAKDFRTWAATVLAAIELTRLGAAESDASRKRNVAKAIKVVAGRLGNTPAVCRSSYVHPEVIEGYLDGSLTRAFHPPGEEDEAGVFAAERAVLRFLRGRLNTPKAEQRRPQPGLADALTLSIAAK
jgi:DNA topoisomerase-1